MRVWSLSQFLQLKTTKGIVNCSYWKWCHFSASYPPHVTFTGESNSSLVLYVNVKAWWRQTSWELYVCSPRKKSVTLKSSLLDRLLTTNVEHTYMYLTNNIYIYIYIYVYNYLKTSTVKGMTRTCCYMLQKYIEVTVLISTHCFIVTVKNSHDERPLLSNTKYQTAKCTKFKLL